MNTQKTEKIGPFRTTSGIGQFFLLAHKEQGVTRRTIAARCSTLRIKPDRVVKLLTAGKLRGFKWPVTKTAEKIHVGQPKRMLKKAA